MRRVMGPNQGRTETKSYLGHGLKKRTRIRTHLLSKA